MWITFLLFAIGLIIIVKGGDWFVDSTIWIAEVTGISFGIIGATLVSLATTMPEFFVSIISSIEGFTEMSVGNALGSIICNIAFIIGLTSLIRPTEVKGKFFAIKGAMMLFCLAVFYLFALDGVVSRIEGIVLIALTSLFFLMNLLEYKADNKKTGKPKVVKNTSKKEMYLNASKFIIGAILIIVGADLLVDSGVDIAEFLNIPKQVVSLTLLAIGTSLPELVTALSSLIKGKANISVGNIVGANVLNVTMVMGGAALVSSNGLIISQQTLTLHIPVAIIITLIFVLSGIFFGKINRFLALILLTLYGGYLYILF